MEKYKYIPKIKVCVQPSELQPCNIFILFLVRYGCNIVKKGQRWIEIFTFAIGSKNELLKTDCL